VELLKLFLISYSGSEIGETSKYYTEWHRSHLTLLCTLVASNVQGSVHHCVFTNLCVCAKKHELSV